MTRKYLQFVRFSAICMLKLCRFLFLSGRNNLGSIFSFPSWIVADIFRFPPPDLSVYCLLMDSTWTRIMEPLLSLQNVTVLRLCSFLYDLNRNFDSIARVNSGSMIQVQVESVKRQKTERSGKESEKYPLLSVKERKI